MIPCVFCGSTFLFRVALAEWGCADCERRWVGRWRNVRQRWTISVPVETVPWASGTTADLECYRRGEFWGFLPGIDERADGCCRWPKSCSAFDPGFTVGKGPTTLPVVWFDGFGWRSGPPDLTKIPQHLRDGIWAAWLVVNPNNDLRDYWNYGPGSVPMTSPEEANDDDGDDGEAGGCGEACCKLC